jgi:hypothetical protein
MSVSRRGSSLLMPIIESCRLMPWTREETQSSSTKEKENRKFKTAIGIQLPAIQSWVADPDPDG